MDYLSNILIDFTIKLLEFNIYRNKDLYRKKYKIINEDSFTGIYMNEDRKKNKLILYVHGGGYIIGSEYISNNFFNSINDNNEVSIFSLKYTLGSYITASKELISAIKYFRDQFKEIILVGSSAGAHLIFSNVNYFKDVNIKIIAISPWTASTEYFNNSLYDTFLKRAYQSEPINLLQEKNNKYPETLVIYSKKEIILPEIKKFLKKINKETKLSVYEIDSKLHSYPIIIPVIQPYYSKKYDTCIKIVKNFINK